MQKLQSLPYECAKFVEFLTHPDFPFFPGGAKAQQAWGCLEQQHQQHGIPNQPWMRLQDITSCSNLGASCAGWGAVVATPEEHPEQKAKGDISLGEGLNNTNSSQIYAKMSQKAPQHLWGHLVAGKAQTRGR